MACPQLPTTLPTLDEIIGREGIAPDNAAQRLLQLTAKPLATGHVFTLHAELEGGKWITVFEQLLRSWKEQGYELVSLSQYLSNLKGSLPRHEVTTGTVEGRSGTLAVQAG